MHLLRLTLMIVGISCAFACRAGEGVYAFVDAEGEVHLSNVPDNERYRSLDAPVAPSAGKWGGSAERDDSVGRVPRRPYGALVSDMAKRYGVEAALLHAVISVESGYNARAVSKRGAAGLMQLMPETARRYGVTNVLDPADNVRAGAQYLTYLLKLFDNDLRLALAAYNAGEAAVIKYGRRIPPYRETAEYVPRVVDFYQKFRLLM